MSSLLFQFHLKCVCLSIKSDSRPSYTGIATIKSISRAKNNKYVFDVCTPGSQRIIPSIPGKLNAAI